MYFLAELWTRSKTKGKNLITISPLNILIPLKSYFNSWYVGEIKMISFPQKKFFFSNWFSSTSLKDHWSFSRDFGIQSPIISTQGFVYLFGEKVHLASLSVGHEARASSQTTQEPPTEHSFTQKNYSSLKNRKKIIIFLFNVKRKININFSH